MVIENPLENNLWSKYTYIMGLDEAGRGPIAGPLVVSCVVFDPFSYPQNVYDSKKLSAKKREELYDEIIKTAKYYAIEIVDVKSIDELNIYQATKKAMEKLTSQFPCDYVLSDAMPLHSDIPYEAVVKGDQKSVSIASASILAKVTRDRLMQEIHEQYPNYGFDTHKGYGTKKHKMALEEYGYVLGIHRSSYEPVKGVIKNDSILKR